LIITNPVGSLNISHDGKGTVNCTITNNPNNFISKAEFKSNRLAVTVNRFQSGGSISVQAPESTNYKASNTINISVDSQYIKALKDCDLDEIVTISGSGLAKNVWHAGDYKAFTMDIPAGKSANVVQWYTQYHAVILGFKHNFDAENGGKSNYVDFMITNADGTPLLFDEVGYGTDAGNDCTREYGGKQVPVLSWHSNPFVAINHYLPEVWRKNSMVNKNQYTVNQNTLVQSATAAILLDMAPCEVTGASSPLGTQYEYFANGNGLPFNSKYKWILTRELGLNGSTQYVKLLTIVNGNVFGDGNSLGLSVCALPIMRLGK